MLSQKTEEFCKTNFLRIIYSEAQKGKIVHSEIKKKPEVVKKKLLCIMKYIALHQIKRIAKII